MTTGEEVEPSPSNNGVILKIFCGCAFFVLIGALAVGGLVYSQRHVLFPTLCDRESDEAQKKIRERYAKEGGLQMLLRLSYEKGKVVDKVLLHRQCMDVVRNRLDLAGVSDGYVIKKDADTIEVLIPGINETAQASAKTLLLSKDLVAFYELAENGETTNVFSLMTRKKEGLIVVAGLAKKKEEQSWFLLKDKVLLGTTDLKHVRVGFDSIAGMPKILISCTEQGTIKLRDVTNKLMNKRMAIVVGGKVFMAPVIRGAIAGGHAEITGQFELEEVRKVVNALKAGCLPCVMTEVKG